MRIEWNREKALSNYKKHGISFDEAVSVFFDPLAATFDDPDHSLDERRLITIGYSPQDRLIVVFARVLSPNKNPRDCQTLPVLPALLRIYGPVSDQQARESILHEVHS